MNEICLKCPIPNPMHRNCCECNLVKVRYEVNE